MTPSGAKRKDHAPVHSPSGMKFGSEVHAILEQIAWLDESRPALPQTAAGQAVASLLDNPALHEVFQRRGRAIELFREQAVDAILEDQLLSGIIDRLHLHRNPAGTVHPRRNHRLSKPTR